jgi:hypothetical protein
MKIRPCPREPEVRELIQRGNCEPELRAHIDTCAVCAEAVQFAQLFQTARADSMLRAPIDSAGPLWWRAQLRRRNAALERIGRPLRTAQIFAAAICLLATAGLVIFEERSGNSQGLLSLPSQLWSFASTTTGWSLTLLISSLSLLTVVAATALFLSSETNETSRH